MTALPGGVEITAGITPEFAEILTPDALAFVAKLSRSFEARRQQLLAARVERAKKLDAGERPDFLPDTAAIRSGDWNIAPLPEALYCRRVEITGPVDRKMVINALNSGADAYMSDFEDSNTPNWSNQISGQINLRDAIRRNITLEQNGKSYQLNDKVATLLVRPRGWHLDEKPAASSTSRSICSIAPRSCWPAELALISICPRSSRISRHVFGTTSLSWHKTRSACRAAPSRQPS
jgi:malate synthase